MDKEVPLTDLTNFQLISKCAKLGSELKQLQSSQSEGKSEKKALADRDAIITLLDDYSKYLEENGFLDTDWKAEKPYAIDDFLSKNRKPPIRRINPNYLNV